MFPRDGRKQELLAYLMVSQLFLLRIRFKEIDCVLQLTAVCHALLISVALLCRKGTSIVSCFVLLQYGSFSGSRNCYGKLKSVVSVLKINFCKIKFLIINIFLAKLGNENPVKFTSIPIPFLHH